MNGHVTEPEKTPDAASPSSAPSRWRRWALRARGAFTRFAVFLTLALAIVQLTPVERWYARWLAGPWNDPDGDVLIVLSAEEEPDDIIGLVSYWRAVYAVRVWRESHFRAVVVSGGHTKGGHLSLAAVIGQFLVAYGVPQEKVFLEDQSTSTRENALFTTRMVSGWPGRKVLLTSDVHMFRARRTFEAAGLAVLPRPVPDLLKHEDFPIYRLPDAWTLTLETIKIGGYWIRGWIHLP